MKKVFIGITAVFAGFMVFSYNTPTGYTNPSGAPAQSAGAPNDGGISTGTCGKSSCHNVNATEQAGMITSNIPVSGYIPGQTYTITGTISSANKIRFGFQITPQSATGQLKGQIVITNTTDTKIVSSKYVTHKTAGNSGQGSRTWSFNWVAPAAGTGDVTFYGAFMAANNNGNENGDLVFASNLTVTEATVGVNDMEAEKPEVIVFPNPANGAFNVAVSGAKSAISTKVFNTEGRLVYSNVYNNTNAAKHVIDINEGAKLSAGLYFVSVEAEGISKIVKLVVQ